MAPSPGASEAWAAGQIEGELAWERLLRRNVTPFVNVSTEEVNEVYDRIEERLGVPKSRAE